MDVKPRTDQTPAGRGAGYNPPNRYESLHVVRESDSSAWWEEVDDDERPRLATEFLPDNAQSIIASNDSPDVPYSYSINPYRGCEHGCPYCYARPTHEQLGMSSGLDFESRILVKYEAARLLRRELCRPSWSGEIIALSGVTDCYQPCERKFRLTRGLLEVLREARQAALLITKNALVLRDLDLLADLAAEGLVRVSLSITSLDSSLTRRVGTAHFGTGSPFASDHGVAGGRCACGSDGCAGHSRPDGSRVACHTGSGSKGGSRGGRLYPVAAARKCRAVVSGLAGASSSVGAAACGRTDSVDPGWGIG